MKRSRLSPLLLGIAAVLALASPRPARAQDPIVAGTPEVTAGFATGRFRLPFTGDAAHHASVLVTYCRGPVYVAAEADSAVVPVRDDVHSRFTGVLLWLDSGTTYTARIAVTDPDGGDATFDRTFTTRTPEGHPIPADPVFVSPAGDDANPGTLASPRRTIAGANALMPARGPGAQIRLLPGIYYETAWLQAEGAPGQYYSIVGQGNPDSIIVDGSDPALLHAVWTPYRATPGGPQVHSIYTLDTPNAALVKNVVAGWGQRLHRKVSLDELANPGSYPNYPDQGWFRSGNTLYVRLEGGADPQQTTMHVAIRDHGLRITGDYWRAESLTVRFTSDKGYFLGAYGLRDSFASHAVIRNCRGVSCGAEHVFGNVNSNHVLVDSCRFEDGRIDTWTYFASKARWEETATGITTVGRGWTIRNCTVSGTSNGIQVTGSPDSLEWGSDAEVYYDRVTRQADDGIENDGGHDVNQVIWGNVIDRCNHGFSPNPVFTGPIYVLYDLFDGSDDAALKMGGGTTGVCIYAHDIFTSASCSSAITHVGGGYRNQVFRNNVLSGVVDLSVPCFSYPLSDGNAGMDTTVTAFGPLFDGDLWWAVTPWWNVCWWNGLNRDWNYVRDALHWEANGTNLAPSYADSGAWNFAPVAGASQVDRGLRLQGINTRHLTGTPLYVGLPDVGAYELGLASSPAWPRFGADFLLLASPREAAPAGGTLALSPAWPNPARGAVHWSLALPRGARVDARVYDLLGRQVAVVSEGAWREAGAVALEWTGRGPDGAGAHPGVYFLRVSAGSERVARPVVRLR